MALPKYATFATHNGKVRKIVHLKVKIIQNEDEIMGSGFRLNK